MLELPEPQKNVSDLDMNYRAIWVSNLYHVEGNGRWRGIMQQLMGSLKQLLPVVSQDFGWPNLWQSKHLLHVC